MRLALRKQNLVYAFQSTLDQMFSVPASSSPSSFRKLFIRQWECWRRAMNLRRPSSTSCRARRCMYGGWPMRCVAIRLDGSSGLHVGYVPGRPHVGHRPVIARFFWRVLFQHTYHMRRREEGVSDKCDVRRGLGGAALAVWQCVAPPRCLIDFPVGFLYNDFRESSKSAAFCLVYLGSA